MPAAANAKQQLANQLVDQAVKVIPVAAAAVVSAVAKADWSRATDATPTARLRRKIDVTIEVAGQRRDDALADDDREAAQRATAWAKRAKELRTTLDLPVTTSKVKHRRQVKVALASLHEQMGLDSQAASLNDPTDLTDAEGDPQP